MANHIQRELLALGLLPFPAFSVKPHLLAAWCKSILKLSRGHFHRRLKRQGIDPVTEPEAVKAVVLALAQGIVQVVVDGVVGAPKVVPAVLALRPFSNRYKNLEMTS